MKSLYIHFPFCETKCHYCDFYSLGRERTKDGDADQFEEALLRECTEAASQLSPTLETLFFGGGTPSMTPPESMARATAPLKIKERLAPDYEWTMEANPSSVDTERLRQYREIGVNRISMGVQAMRDDLLLKLGRVHSREKALFALDAIFAAGYTNVSVDLLCGVPGQTTDDIKTAIDALTAFPITHLSCYLLTLTKTHKMYKDLPDEDTQLEHLQCIHDEMTARGFEHYEISNYAKPGKRARHNLAYWKGLSYLGLGPSAHSFDADLGKRWKNISALHQYARVLGEGKLPIEWSETLTDDQKHLERWMLALRLSEGFPENWLEKPLQLARAKALTQEGLIERHPDDVSRLRLTPRGFAVSESIIQALS